MSAVPLVGGKHLAASAETTHESSTGQAGAPAEGPYQLQNPFWSITGSYGKLTNVGVDPAGSGNYQTPSTFQSIFIGETDTFNSSANPGVTWQATATSLSLSNIQIGSSTATWQLTLHGSELASSFTVTPASGDTVSDPGLSLVIPWQEAGYSTAYADGVIFSRFFSDQGQYMPAQQLKRRPSWGTWDMSPAGWIYATGTGSYDIRIASDSLGINGVSPIAATSMSLQLLGVSGAQEAPVSHAYTIEVLPHSDELPAALFPSFTASDEARAEQLTTFFHERALSTGPAHLDTYFTEAEGWLPALYSWQPGGNRQAEASNIQAISLDPDGYVWSENGWGTRGWSIVSQTTWDARHFNTNAMYILGTWQQYSWTGDEDFLAVMMPRVRQALNFLLDTLGGSSGLMTIGAPDHTGVPQALGTNYWDISTFGYLSAYENAYFYGALEAQSQLEAHVGNVSRANQLRRLRTLVAKKYNETFWNDDAGRYIMCVDVDGVPHDYGSVYVNLEAMSWGLASLSQAARIYSWMEEGATELTSNVLFLNTGTGSTTLAAGQTCGQTFTATASFAQVAPSIGAVSQTNTGFTLTLYEGGPGGTEIASHHYAHWRWPSGWAPLDVGEQPAGDYYLEMSDADTGIGWVNGPTYTGGSPYQNGSPTTGVPSRTLLVISPYSEGPADIYSYYGWAPRATSRKNNFQYLWLWEGFTVPWGVQLQDGGTDLYLCGFDVFDRARYTSADDAWDRLTTLLDRWAKPDHLCGGSPLYDGEIPQNEVSAGAVGVDIPFPESGLAPASFLYAFIGLEPRPDALLIRPNLPSSLSSAGVKGLVWRGHQVEIQVTKSTVSVEGGGISKRFTYEPGDTVSLPA